MVYLTRRGTSFGQVAFSRPKISLWWGIVWVLFLIFAHLLDWLDVMFSDFTGKIIIATAMTTAMFLLNLLYQVVQKRIKEKGPSKSQKTNSVLLLLGTGAGFGIFLAVLVFFLVLYGLWQIFSMIAYS